METLESVFWWTKQVCLLILVLQLTMAVVVTVGTWFEAKFDFNDGLVVLEAVAAVATLAWQWATAPQQKL